MEKINTLRNYLLCKNERYSFIGTVEYSHNRVARPTMQNMAGRGSHTTVRTGLVYSGSLNIGRDCCATSAIQKQPLFRGLYNWLLKSAILHSSFLLHVCLVFLVLASIWHSYPIISSCFLDTSTFISSFGVRFKL